MHQNKWSLCAEPECDIGSVSHKMPRDKGDDLRGKGGQSNIYETTKNIK